MSIQRSFAGRRLRVEVLEDRAVPAATATDPTTVTPPNTDPTKPAVTDTTAPTKTGDATTTDETTTDAPVVTSMDGDLKPTDPAPGDVVPPDVTDPADPPVILTATGDPQPTDASAPSVDLATVTTVDKPTPSVGDVVTVTVRVTNKGTDPATGVTVAAALPAGMTFVSANSGQGTYDASTGTWTPDSVAPGTPATLSIKAKVTDAAAQSVSASISHADQPDPQTGNNTASTTVTPVQAGIQVGQSFNTRTASLGSLVMVTVTVRNMGPGAAKNVAVTESLGSGLVFVRAMTPTRGTYNPGTKVWTIPSLSPGMPAQLQIVAQVSQAGQVQAAASAAAAGIDPTTSQTDATATLNVVRTALPATWTYFNGAQFKPGPGQVPVQTSVPATPAPATNRPVLPTPPATSSVAQLLIARGFILPSGFHM